MIMTFNEYNKSCSAEQSLKCIVICTKRDCIQLVFKLYSTLTF